MLEGAVQRLKAWGSPALPVLRDAEVVGALTMENVGEFLIVHRRCAPTEPLSSVA